MEHFWHFLIQNGLPFTGFVLSFFLVFTFHEYAHCVFARLFDVRVLSLAIGYGREFITFFDRHGTKWSFHILPFVGAITLAGQQKIYDDPHDDFSKKIEQTPKEELFSDKPVWKRLIIVMAGPISNFVLAFIILLFALSVIGEPLRPPVINGVKLGSSAHEAGFQPGDRVVSINGVDIDSFHQMKDIIHKSADEKLTVRVKRDDHIRTHHVTPKVIAFQDQRSIHRAYPQIGILSQTKPLDLKSFSEIDGVETNMQRDKARDLFLENMGKSVNVRLKTVDGNYTPHIIFLHPGPNTDLTQPDSVYYDSVFIGEHRDNDIRRYAALNAISASLDETWRLMKGVASLPYNAVPFDRTLIDPPADMTGEYYPARYVLYKIMFLAATMSIFLGMINLLPIPGFDGSRIITILSDTLKNGETLEPYFQRAALVLFLFTVVFANSLRVGAI